MSLSVDTKLAGLIGLGSANSTNSGFVMDYEIIAGPSFNVGRGSTWDTWADLGFHIGCGYGYNSAEGIGIDGANNRVVTDNTNGLCLTTGLRMESGSMTFYTIRERVKRLYGVRIIYELGE